MRSSKFGLAVPSSSSLLSSWFSILSCRSSNFSSYLLNCFRRQSNTDCTYRGTMLSKPLFLSRRTSIDLDEVSTYWSDLTFYKITQITSGSPWNAAKLITVANKRFEFKFYYKFIGTFFYYRRWEAEK